jgi:uncharacterized membrane protein
MRSPFAPLPLAVFVALIAVLLFLVQFEIMGIAFAKLGLSRHSALLLLVTSLIGSGFNLPLFVITSQAPTAPPSRMLRRLSLLRPPQRPFQGKTVVAVNVGGCVIPLVFSVYLLAHNPLTSPEVVAALALVTLTAYLTSFPVAGLGVAMPILVAPVTAAVAATFINAELSAPLAYVAGTLGVLLGADVLRLRDIRTLGTPMASIGGAGTFDGIFLTGIVAVLLA